jgi:DNA-binding Xre family transcriptional regulator
MAKVLGVSQPTLNRIESAQQNTTIRTLSIMCRALRCHPGDLFTPGSVRFKSRKTR